MLFALVAGAATALSPCVLPVLPAVLGAGVSGGRRRPLGVVTGLVLAFTFATVALVYVIDALGLPDDLVRTLAIVTLFAFGITLLIPGLGDRIEAFGSRIAPGPARVGGDGFGSGLLLGASLGLVYTPCAGPILAGVITVSAAQDFTAGKLAVALAYAVGSGAVLYLLMLGGRRLVDRLKPARAWVQAATGVDDGPGRGGDDRRPRPPVPERDRRRPARRSSSTRAAGSSAATRSPTPLAAVRGAARRRPRAGRPQAAARRDAARLRRGAGLRRHPAVVQHAGGKPLSIAELTRRGPCRADRLLDLHLHQLHPHAPLPRVVGRRVPQGRPDDRRRALARVPVREGRRQRRGRDRTRRDPLPGGPGQRPRHLERVRQPVLAGQVPDRRERRGPLRPLRRGQLRPDRGGDPLAARRGRAGAARRRARSRTQVERPDPTLRTPETYLGAARAQGLSTGRSREQGLRRRSTPAR